VSTALNTDRYELTMLQAALRSGKADRKCVFEVFSRQLPAGRRYGVVAGTGRVLEAIQNFRFGDQELSFLAQNQVVDSQTLKWLESYQFSGNVSGYQEGELYFGHSPILTVEGSFAEAVILETVILSILNYDSAVASAAARMKSVANERRLIEMGSRRAHEEAAIAAARAAYIAGFDATSNLAAGSKYGIETTGTSAHAFTLLHDNEEQAFEAQLASMGNETTLLVDTYDVRNAVETAVRLSGGKIRAVRLDSGDLATSAVEVRKQLDALGAKQTKITVTSDLDEYTIAALAIAPIDSYGVGTSLVTGSGFPTAGFVYKLVAHTDNGDWVDVAKTSKLKTNRGGRKFASRALDRGVAKTELISSELQAGRALQVEMIANGEIAVDLMGKTAAEKAREHHKLAMAELPAGALRLSRGEPAVPVEFI
jgi:nicotinate phosphoribosyltransferase